MVVKEDGTKWACHSCLKGHRVSGCNHTDRELIQVPKKGRPVTQCQHCRQERKKRSAHVSCDCGDSGKHHHTREKCIHLREAEERAKAGLHDEPPAEKDPVHLAAIAEEQGCCCHHGGKCTCSILKRETGADAGPHGPAVKPRLEKTTSDGAITNFTNGHHKPVHRKNHAAHEHGMPYKLPVPRSNSETSSDSGTGPPLDSLPSENSVPFQEGSWLPPTSASYPQGRRRSKSEQTSPRLNASQPLFGGLADFSAPPLDFANLAPTSTNESAYSAASSNMEFPPFDQMSGFGEDDLDPWTDMSALDTTTIKPSQNQLAMQAWASGSSDNIYQPDLTSPSSGAQSESDDIASKGSVYGMSLPSYPGEPSAFDFDLNNSDSPPPNRHSLPPGFFGNADFTHGNMSSEWQQAVANSAAANQGVLSASPNSMDGTWSQPARGGITSSTTPFEHSPIGTRPQSRSLGPSSAPTNDALRELFPDMDLDNIPNLSHSQQQNVDSRKTFNGMPSSMPTSAPIPFEQQQQSQLQGSPDNGMPSQPWTDASFSMAPESYIGLPSGYDSDQGFNSQPYTPPDWSR